MPDTEYTNLDVAALAESVGNDLFGTPEADGSEVVSGLPSDPITESSNLPTDKVTAEGENSGAGVPPIVASPNPELVVDPLPKSWKKEMEADWKSLPDSVRKYVNQRETQVMQGIQQYHQGHQAYSAIIEPFKEIFAANPDKNPVSLMQNLMHSHVKLLTLPQEEKAQFVQALLSSYGIDFNAQGSAVNPDYAKLRAELDETRRYIRDNQQRAHQAEVARYDLEVKEFQAKNPLFSEVQNDILRLISTGAVQDLKTAYETAVWANPATRTKLLAQQAEEAEAARIKNQKPKPVNIDANGSARVRVKPKSIDDTIDSVVAKYANQH